MAIYIALRNILIKIGFGIMGIFGDTLELIRSKGFVGQKIILDIPKKEQSQFIWITQISEL